MQVKIFENIDQMELQSKINIWLADNPGIQIKYITQSQSHDTTTMIAIWYERPLH